MCLVRFHEAIVPKTTMKFEYESLREEIKAWQERRFTVLAGSIVLVTGILGLKIVGESKPSESWPWASALLLVFLAAACALTWYARRANTKIAAYLIVFHESGSDPLARWESQLDELKRSKSDRWDLNRLMIPIYVGLALLSVFAPMLSHREYHLVWADYITLGVAGTVFLVMLIPLGRSAPREHYIHLWTELKQRNEKANGIPPGDVVSTGSSKVEKT